MDKPLLSLVLSSGLLDSINPCAIAILLLFIALIFTFKKERAAVLRFGLTYILAVYLTYLAIGLGLLKVVHLFGIPHFFTKLGAGLVILVGLLNIKDVVWPHLPIHLNISLGTRAWLSRWAFKASLPASFVLGFLVGICEFPCSGAIYLAIIGLLASKVTFWAGLSYLLLYNLMFVLPLIVILLIATNKIIVEKMTMLEEQYSTQVRLISGLVMIGLGIFILIWFV